MNKFLNHNTGALILRLSLGSILLAHSVYLKMMVFTLPGTADFFSSIGLPGFMAYVVFIIEAIAGIALIVGYQTRVFAAMVIPVLLGATWAHSSSGWLFTNNGGGWEYPLFLTLTALVQLSIGGGKYVVSFRKTKIEQEPETVY